jgi:hypothetical protein
MLAIDFIGEEMRTWRVLNFCNALLASTLAQQYPRS